MSLSKEQVDALAAALRELPAVTTVSKQEAVRMLGGAIENLKAQGYSNRAILEVLREGGLEISSVDMLKNYLSRAKRRAIRDQPPMLTLASPTQSSPRSVQPAPEAQPNLPNDGPSTAKAKPGWFTPVLHCSDEDV